MDSLRLSITNAVIGCSEVERTATFFARLGLTEMETERVPGEIAATLYGLQHPVDSLRMSAPGSFAVGCEGDVDAPSTSDRLGAIRLEVWPSRSGSRE